jgi:hypothetical protein
MNHIELAAVIATHGRAFVAGRKPVSYAALEQYWTASKCRLDRWSRTLKSFTTAVHHDRTSAMRDWPSVRPIIEEILLSEILTRVWTAVLAAHDHQIDARESEPVAHSVLLGHLEARHRALALLVYGPGVGTVAAQEVNRVRLLAERWSDFLIGGLVLEGDQLDKFAVNPDRARQFAADLRDRRNQQGSQLAWKLTLASLRAAFRDQNWSASPNADANRCISCAIIACFPPHLFDATGVLRSLWQIRLANGASDTQGLLDELLRLDAEPALESSKPRRFNAI